MGFPKLVVLMVCWGTRTLLCFVVDGIDDIRCNTLVWNKGQFNGLVRVRYQGYQVSGRCAWWWVGSLILPRDWWIYLVIMVFVCFLYGYVLFPGTDYGCWYMLPFCMVHRREYILDLIFSAVALAISILNFLLFLIQWFIYVRQVVVWYYRRQSLSHRITRWYSVNHCQRKPEKRGPLWSIISVVPVYLHSWHSFLLSHTEVVMWKKVVGCRKS